MPQSGNSALDAMLKGAGLRLSGWRGEVSRRSNLARQPRPAGISGPSARRLIGELGVFAELSGKAGEVGAARHPQPIMLLPGFGSHPARMKPLYRSLQRAGHKVENWGLGFNLGPTPANFQFLLRRVRLLARKYGEPITLIGWSLGGLFAREIAHRQPESVSRVITMGTPFSGDPHANNGWRAYELVTGHAVERPPIDNCTFSAKPPVPTIAMWSPRDGVVKPRSAAGWPGERDRAVALRCTHLGFPRSPTVIAEVLRQLDLQD